MSTQVLTYSGLNKYQNCPHQFYRTRVKKDIVEDFSGEAAVWGRAVHKAIEDYLKHDKPLSDKFKQYTKYVEHLARIEGNKYIECRLAMDEDSNPTKFFDKNAAYRGILDYLVIRPGGKEALLIDHKTGKVRPTKQLHFNALLVFAKFPKVRILRSAFFWLPADTYTKFAWHRNDIDGVWSEFDTPITNLRQSFEDDNWPKKQSGLCPWCPVHDCEHYSPERRK